MRVGRGYQVMIVGQTYRGRDLVGEGFTRDAAAHDAKVKLSRERDIAIHEITLIFPVRDR
jgi:hypothetical protein